MVGGEGHDSRAHALPREDARQLSVEVRDLGAVERAPVLVGFGRSGSLIPRRRVGHVRVVQVQPHEQRSLHALVDQASRMSIVFTATLSERRLRDAVEARADAGALLVQVPGADQGVGRVAALLEAARERGRVAGQGAEVVDHARVERMPAREQGDVSRQRDVRGRPAVLEEHAARRQGVERRCRDVDRAHAPDVIGAVCVRGHQEHRGGGRRPARVQHLASDRTFRSPGSSSSKRTAIGPSKRSSGRAAFSQPRLGR